VLVAMFIAGLPLLSIRPPATPSELLIGTHVVLGSLAVILALVVLMGAWRYKGLVAGLSLLAMAAVLVGLLAGVAIVAGMLHSPIEIIYAGYLKLLAVVVAVLSDVYLIFRLPAEKR
jgi:heme A synthase